jgi:Flp pilus assembly secretin CpaC
MTEKYPNVTISAKRTTSSGSDSLDLSMNMAAIPGEDKFMFAKEAFFSWGIDLEVTPRISTNGLINVSIVPTISSRTDWVTAGASDTAKEEDSNAGSYSARYPVINVQRLITEFNMASETTAVIGGLSRTIETQKDNGIPWLRDIWWIGPKLFGSKVRVKEQKEIIVFVTVGLIDPRDMKKDAGLPKNAVLGRQYTKGQRQEPGDKSSNRMLEGVGSLDLRSLEEQAKEPLPEVDGKKNVLKNLPKPFTKKNSKTK